MEIKKKKKDDVCSECNFVGMSAAILSPFVGIYADKDDGCTFVPFFIHGKYMCTYEERTQLSMQCAAYSIQVINKKESN